MAHKCKKQQLLAIPALYNKYPLQWKGKATMHMPLGFLR